MITPRSSDQATSRNSPKLDLANVRLDVHIDRSGVALKIPGLLTSNGVLISLVDYFRVKASNRSISWMTKRVQAVRLFLEYWVAHSSEQANYKLFSNFVNRLRAGSYGGAIHLDASGLGWRPRNMQTIRQIIAALNEFFSFLAESQPNAAFINPISNTCKYDAILIKAAHVKKRDYAFLGHLWSANPASTTSRLVSAGRSVKTNRSDPPAFPESQFPSLISKGFLCSKHLDYRNILITLLLNGAGLRISEVLQLYITDVIPNPTDPKTALVLIHHPFEGTAPNDPSYSYSLGKNRTSYLAARWGMQPRPSEMGRSHSGWKGGAHETAYGSKYFEAYWFEPILGEIFLKYWHLYLQEVAMLERNNPYAFVNMRGGTRGSPYALAQFNKSHAMAVKRIGLTPMKSAGTTPHGHRHAYGKRLKQAGIAPELIQRFMHHASIESHRVYTEPTAQEARDAIKAALNRLEEAQMRQRIEQLEKLKDLSQSNFS